VVFCFGYVWQCVCMGRVGAGDMFMGHRVYWVYFGQLWLWRYWGYKEMGVGDVDGICVVLGSVRESVE
jgi:hypothetical protein